MEKIFVHTTAPIFSVFPENRLIVDGLEIFKGHTYFIHPVISLHNGKKGGFLFFILVFCYILASALISELVLLTKDKVFLFLIRIYGVFFPSLPTEL